MICGDNENEGQMDALINDVVGNVDYLNEYGRFWNDGMDMIEESDEVQGETKEDITMIEEEEGEWNLKIINFTFYNNF